MTICPSSQHHEPLGLQGHAWWRATGTGQAGQWPKRPYLGQKDPRTQVTVEQGKESRGLQHFLETEINHPAH